MTVTEKLTALLAAANATTGASDADLTGAISSLIDGYGQGGGGILHDRGTIAFHTGSNLTTCTIPVSEQKNSYLVRAMATKTWKKVDGVWTENAGLDYTGLSQYSFLYYFAKTGVDNYPAWINKSGNTIDATAAYINRPYINPSLTHVGAVNSKQSTSDNPRYSNGNIVFDTGTGRMCDTTFGLTIEYDIWGWNDAE